MRPGTLDSGAACGARSSCAGAGGRLPHDLALGRSGARDTGRTGTCSRIGGSRASISSWARAWLRHRRAPAPNGTNASGCPFPRKRSARKTSGSANTRGSRCTRGIGIVSTTPALNSRPATARGAVKGRTSEWTAGHRAKGSRSRKLLAAAMGVAVIARPERGRVFRRAAPHAVAGLPGLSLDSCEASCAPSTAPSFAKESGPLSRRRSRVSRSRPRVDVPRGNS
jgi:hypothetical protein